jgi:[ribosomal protein S18]-alanine N-acetyltransferase
VLPLARLGGRGTYLVAWDDGAPVAHAHVAWDDGAPVAHAHVAWTDTQLGVPEIQDVFVCDDRRRQGLGTAVTLAAERAAEARGHRRISIGTSIDNDAARGLYEKLGYRDAGAAPVRVQGTIMIRTGPLEVDDTIVYLVKELPVDFGSARSS